ncbi:hypothetical protein ACF07V_19360 [Streptomyces sp. NPDC015661]|uniref:hypothetical protein n=1 Tax=Streptomyces sp. NPDC015661 TaxID=3364961 RepID=UPI0036FA966C
MSWYLALPSAVLGVLMLAGGAATLSSGWIMPWQRGSVYRPRFFGWGQLLMGAALAIQASTALVDDRATRSTVQGAGVGFLLAGLILLTLSQRPRQDA